VTPPRSPLVDTWRFVALATWGVGVQVHELIGTIGLAALVASFVPQLARLTREQVKAWWPLLAFIGWALVAPTLGGNPPDGTGVARTLDWATVPFVAAAVAALSVERRSRLVALVLGTLTLSCAVAGLQHLGWWPNESAFSGLEALRIPFNRVYEPVSEGASRYMGGGLLFHRLKFSHVSGLALVVLVVAAARDVKRRGVLIGLGVFAFIAVWLFPYARMGAVAATAGVAVTLARVSPSPKKALLAIGALGLVGALAVLAVEPLRARFVAGLTDQGSGQRTQHLGAGLEAIRQHPLVGVGPGQFRPSKFGGPDMPEHVRDNPGKAHNQFVSMAAETGLVGAAGFIALLAWLGVRARSRPLGALTLGALAQFVVLSLVHDPLFQAPYSMGLVLLLGAGLAEDTRSADPGAAAVAGRVVGQA